MTGLPPDELELLDELELDEDELEELEEEELELELEELEEDELELELDDEELELEEEEPVPGSSSPPQADKSATELANNVVATARELRRSKVFVNMIYSIQINK